MPASRLIAVDVGNARIKTRAVRWRLRGELAEPTKTLPLLGNVRSLTRSRLAGRRKPITSWLGGSQRQSSGRKHGCSIGWANIARPTASRSWRPATCRWKFGWNGRTWWASTGWSTLWPSIGCATPAARP